MKRLHLLEGRVALLPDSQQDMVRVWLRTASESDNVLVVQRAMQCATLVMARHGLHK
jgi:uncharacterized metal-binding protein